MKRIGIDAHMLGDRSGGNETYYKNILENMEVPEGIEIYVFVTKKADISKIKDKFKIIYFSEHGAIYRNLIELPLFCIKYKLDLLHVQYFIPFIRPCKIVVTIHDICFEHFKDIFTKREYIRQKLLIPYAARHSKLIFTVSEYSKQDIVRCYNINSDKLVVTYNGIGDEFRKLSVSEIDLDSLNKSYGIRNNYILAVGNLQPRKNLVRLIKSFELLKKEYLEPLQLVIVGKKAWLYDDIFDTISDVVKQDVIFTGYIDQQTLIRIYNGAKCFVYPSLFEGFGIPPLEALACGVPVAVSNSSSIPEVVGDCGLYFDPFDCIDMKNKILQVLNRYEKIRDVVPAFKFSWIDTCRLLTKSYKDILDD